jgi:hypothetical protein
VTDLSTVVPNLLPANLNDIDLQAANRPTEWPSTQFTEGTLSRVSIAGTYLRDDG